MSALEKHIHQSLLSGSCSDITVRIPQWGLKYALHRVVLVQAGFWQGLFEGGFEEVGGECEVGFSDENIGRRAFEICISRLYSPYPTLKIPPALLPSLTHPLTPSFPHPPLLSSPPTEPHTQETSPRLLLSILATAIYLGYNPLIRECLGAVLASVSPWSVVRYLEFAIGRGVGDGEEDDGPAVGMERVAVRYDPDAQDRESLRTVASTIGRAASIKSTLPRAASPESVDVKKESCATAQDKHEDAPYTPPRYFYGFAGEKIGQACVSWLCRWGTDILSIEEEMAAMHDSEGEEQRQTSLVGRMRGISLSDARMGKKMASGHAHSSSWAHTTVAPDAPAISTLRIWARGGLPAEWVRIVVSSDAFWVRDEMERYDFAKRVVALRSAEGEVEDIDEEEEQELGRIFETGIHYSHMTFDQLSQLSADINPATGLPYVPLGVLQAALWASSDYQGKITAYRPDGTTAKGDTEVPKNGVALTTKEVCELAAPVSATIGRKAWLSPSVESSRRARARSSSPAPVLHDLGPALGGTSLGPFTSALDRPFWPVPTDETRRIGDAVNAMNELNPTTGLPDLGPPREGDSPTKVPHDHGLLSGDSGDPYFGFSSPMRTGREILAASQRGMAGKQFDDDALWSRHEPFRFSVEFWGIDKLGEKERAYSHTVWHAGSYFNIYVQTIRKKDKGVQLGIYLHRQSLLEPVPFPSSSRTPSIAPRPRAVAGTDDHIPSMSWNASPGNNTPVGSYPHPQPTSNPLTIQRTMSVTPVGSMPRSMSPTGALSDDEGMGRRNGAEPPSAEMFTDRYWARSKRDENHQKGLHAPYRDQRKTAKVFFSISCASAMGTALTRFSSGPDVFTISQSWGWKSSSLRSQEYLSSYPAPQTQLPPTTSITFADELDPYSPTLERAARPRVNRARSGPSISFQSNPILDGAPNLGERLDQGVLGWISDPIEPILDSASKSGDALKSGFEQWTQKDLRSLRATIVMGVI